MLWYISHNIKVGVIHMLHNLNTKNLNKKCPHSLVSNDNISRLYDIYNFLLITLYYYTYNVLNN